ncbi:TM2 domain-containing protein [Iamia majanohamensis]|uniref:TM2 domain-containing protein n=1 Tax=Iamia majanohamensis TaxID=467976 RepID=A0AAF0BUQ8_9ACTN|nr:TM2 domain-containing protein [Iamia majanohamensis]WCO66338.1 TM2 domain-containing protein [Iamia majanohamensis]
MDLCWSCQAAVEPGRSHCKVCDAAQPTRPDPTLVAPPSQEVAPVAPPPGYGTPAPLPAPPAHGHGAPPAPYGYGGTPMQGYPPAYAAPPAPAYAYAVPTAYAVPVAAPQKSKAVAALLCFFLGGLGIHRFYTGQNGLGLAFLLTSVVGWIVLFFLSVISLGILSILYIPWAIGLFVWLLVDFIMILSGGVSDQYGRELV